MTFSIWQRFIFDDATNQVVAGASIRVRKESDGLDATLYQDAAGAQGLTNPFDSADSGFAFFYAAAGFYRITITYGVNQVDLRNVALGTAQGHDVGTAANQVLLRSSADTLYQRLVLDQLNGARVPGANDDETQGFSIRSMWWDTSADPVDAYICLDATEGAAAWELTTLSPSDLGSAATRNVGTGETEIPTNAQINDIVAVAVADALATTVTDVAGVTHPLIPDNSRTMIRFDSADPCELQLPEQGAFSPGTLFHGLNRGGGTVTLAPQGAATLVGVGSATITGGYNFSVMVDAVDAQTGVITWRTF